MSKTALTGAEGVCHHARPGTLVIDSSTIAPAFTDRAASELAAAGLDFIDAPVGRSPAEAVAGRLLFMVGAEPAQLERARPLLNAMGDTVLHCGSVGSGIRMKLVLNLLSQSTCQLSAEVVALGLKLGLELDTLLGALGGGLGSNGFITRYWPTKVLAGDTAPGVCHPSVGQGSAASQSRWPNRPGCRFRPAARQRRRSTEPASSTGISMSPGYWKSPVSTPALRSVSTKSRQARSRPAGSTFDRAGRQALDDILLQQKHQHDGRQQREQTDRHHQVEEYVNVADQAGDHRR